MTLKAIPSELTAAGHRLTALADDSSTAMSYLADHVSVDGNDDGMVFQNVTMHVETARNELGHVLQRLGMALEGSGTELALLADYYRETDLAEAQRYDAQLPRVEAVPCYAPTPVEDTVPQGDA